MSLGRLHPRTTCPHCDGQGSVVDRVEGGRETCQFCLGRETVTAIEAGLYENVRDERAGREVA